MHLLKRVYVSMNDKNNKPSNVNEIRQLRIFATFLIIAVVFIVSFAVNYKETKSKSSFRFSYRLSQVVGIDDNI